MFTSVKNFGDEPENFMGLTLIEILYYCKRYLLMRAVIQKVTKASVTVDNQVVSSYVVD